jgi:threonine dehydrogenase-like Zn-dependent dehydrogenase
VPHRRACHCRRREGDEFVTTSPRPARHAIGAFDRETTVDGEAANPGGDVAEVDRLVVPRREFLDIEAVSNRDVWTDRHYGCAFLELAGQCSFPIMLTSRAVVQTGPRSLELTELEVPDEIGPEEGLLRIEGCGMCGSDYEGYVGAIGASALPLVPGHEIVGRIERLGGAAAERTGVAVGDRVAVEPGAGPGGVVYSQTGLSRAPGLWGGYADYLWLAAGSRLHRVPDHLTIEDAVLFNPMGAGVGWVRAAGIRAGDSVLIEGPGQRGLTCLVAALEAGAETVIVTGMSSDRHKLDLATKLGATHVVVADVDSVVDTVHEITHGRGVNKTIDVTPFSITAVTDAIEATRRGGTIVLAGVKGDDRVVPLISDRLVVKALTLRGVLGCDSAAFARAIELIVDGRHQLELLHSHTLPLDELERGMQLLGGELEGESTLHVTIVPRTDQTSP